MSTFILKTERLIIREYRLSDANFLLTLINSPKWKKFIGDRGVNNLSDAENYIRDKYFSAYEEHGFGGYICVRKTDEAIVGTCGLYKRPHLNHPDIGFALLSEFEGNGYAYEASTAVMNYGREKFGFEKFHGITLPENTASIRLLEKLGLKEQKRFTMEDDDEELLLFTS